MYTNYKNSTIQKDKIRQKFLDNPKNLHFSKILAFLLSEGYEYKDAKGSHLKLVHIQTKNYISVPIHNGDTKAYYKKELKKLYLSNSQWYEK